MILSKKRALGQKKLGGAPNSPPQLFRVKSEILTKKSGFGGWKYRADKGLKDTVVNWASPPLNGEYGYNKDSPFII